MSVSIDLAGKNAIVTGGTRGIGLEISRRLAEAGARVAMLYRGNTVAAERAVQELNGADTADKSHFAISADLIDIGLAAEGARAAAEQLGGAVDILVLNAGVGTRHAPFAELSMAEWQVPFDLNLNSHVAVLQALYPMMQVGGSVIVIGSGAGHDPLEGMSAYGASKAALNQLAFVLAQEWGPAKGVRVNVISPGSTAKEAVDYENLNERQNETVAGTPLRRLGTSADVADVALFFASELSTFVTGQWVRVNGGRI